MNRKQLMTITLILSLLGIGSSGYAQDAAQNPTAEVPAPAEPVTGYHGMLPYIQENANMRKEAARKYASENPRKKSKSKSKVKSASKKKSRTTASTKKSSSKKKKSPSKRQGSP